MLLETTDLEEAVAMAQRIAPQGSTVLLSRGAPSYGHFENFRERGKTFARIAGFTRRIADNRDEELSWH